MRAIEKLPLRQASDPIRSPLGLSHPASHRPPASTPSRGPTTCKLNLVQMTLALPINASPDEVARATGEAQKAMAGVRTCDDLRSREREHQGRHLRHADRAGRPARRPTARCTTEIPKLPPGGTAGPFRVAEGLQVVALCSKEGANGLPTREVVGQQILLQKLEAASRRYMRDLRRAATIDIVKQP